MIVMFVLRPQRFSAASGVPSDARVTADADVRVTPEGDTRVHADG